MGAWKEWEMGMQDEGFSPAEISDAESRIKGTLADPLVKRQLRQTCDDHPGTTCNHEIVQALMAAFPGAELNESDAA